MHRRPSERAYVRLPALAASQHALETCVFCPKLCRTTCAVSNAVPSETLTPWGKMSAAYFMARGDVDLDESFVEGLYGALVNHPAPDRPDAEALADNPLAIAGFKG